MSVFHFQQFSVIQQHSAMKICTDALLFGAMAPVKATDCVLDIGAGTGLLSLILAQLGAAKITAVELTEPAYQEASTNFRLSPWPSQLTAVHQSIQNFAASINHHYDLIICNPPFFENHSKTVDVLKKAARHTDQLEFSELIAIANQLLTADGLFYVLLPIHALSKIISLANEYNLHLIAQTDLQAYQHSQAKVTALVFSRSASILLKNSLVIYEKPRIYTEESSRFLAGFLLRFAAAQG